jgi:type IV secretion system protein VirD4
VTERVNIWATDGGIYFGCQVADPISTDEEERLLLQKVDVSDVPTEDEPLRGSWKATTEEHRYWLDRHLFTVGPNGSGKTRLLLLPNLIKLPNWSVIVVDPKGSLAAQSGPFRASQPNHRVRVIDPFGVLESSFPEVIDAFPQLKSEGFNPLSNLDPTSERFADDAANIARAIIKTDEQGEKYWARSAQALVKGLLMAIRVEDGEAAHLASVRDIVGSPTATLARMVAKMVEQHAEKYPAIAASLGRFTNISPENREILSIISTAQTQTEWLDSKPIQRSLGGQRHDFAEMKDTPTTVYLILPPEELETQSIWLRLVIACALRPLLRSVRPARVPVLFMLDEFAQLGHMEVIEKNLGLMREYGVKLWPVLQDLGQMKDLYAKRWESFIANAGVLHAFAPQDATTREYLSKLSGEKLYWKKVRNYSGGVNAGASDKASISRGWSESWQSQKGPVYFPQALAAMKAGRAVLFAQGRCERALFPQPEEMPDVRAATALLRKAEVYSSARKEPGWLNRFSLRPDS